MKAQARVAKADPPVAARVPETPKPRIEQRPFVIQRKCGCGGGAGASCECDEEKKVQRKARGLARSTTVPPEVERTLSSPGSPLRADMREQMEARFGHDFGAVRVHIDSASARSVNARAYTVGSHIVFDGPSSAREPRLLAHELTHVAQQRSGTFAAERTISDPGDAHEREADAVAERVIAGATGSQPVVGSFGGHSSLIQREAAPTGEEISVRPLILEDTVVELQQGQMTKTEFLAQLEYTVCAAADESLRRAGRTVDGCPYVTFWFNYYRNRSAEQLERAIRKFAPESTLATDAFEYIPIVTDRVRVAVDVWATTGEVTGVPDAAEIAESSLPAAGVGALSCPAEEASSSPDGVMPKARPGGITPNADPRAIRAQLGAGRSLDGSARSRMERAFGHDFSNVRIHAGARAAAVSSSLNARAFTIGSDIAFGPGEYKPGTLVGDAILAHELAHVVQQSASSPTTSHKKRGANEYGSLEEDADRSAVGAVVSLWSGAKGYLADLARDAMPRLRSGLGLQRCFGCSSGDGKKAEEVKEQVAGDAGTTTGDAATEDAAPAATPIPAPAATKCTKATDADKVVTDFRVEPKVIEKPGDTVTFTASFSCKPVGDGFSQFEGPGGKTFSKEVFKAGLGQFTRKWDGTKLYDPTGVFMVDDGSYKLELLPFKYAYGTGGVDLKTSGSKLKSEPVKVNVGAYKGAGTSHPHYTTANVAELAKVIRTEMGIANDAEKRAVAWSVRNEMLRMNTGDVKTAVTKFAVRDGETAQAADTAMAEEILKKPMSDADNKTQGTIKWFSPRSQPVPDKCKKGDVGCDEIVTFQDDSKADQRRWAPAFHRQMTYVPIAGVRAWWVRFYKL
ncbi:MAG TPA: DUF4157 domain-containing protein [Thermoanaerobaculia bacterium]|nr:DUF4157 domain-containing protein [Thermoanaerobaculia bacterium]